MDDDQTCPEEVLLDAAFAWWESRRPVEFGLDDHIHHPMVNCCGELERALARAVAEQQKLRKKT